MRLVYKLRTPGKIFAVSCFTYTRALYTAGYSSILRMPFRSWIIDSNQANTRVGFHGFWKSNGVQKKKNELICPLIVHYRQQLATPWNDGGLWNVLCLSCVIFDTIANDRDNSDRIDEKIGVYLYVFLYIYTHSPSVKFRGFGASIVLKEDCGCRKKSLEEFNCSPKKFRNYELTF